MVARNRCFQCDSLGEVGVLDKVHRLTVAGWDKRNCKKYYKKRLKEKKMWGNKNTKIFKRGVRLGVFLTVNLIIRELILKIVYFN